MLEYKAHKDAKAQKDITRWASILTEGNEEKTRDKDQRSTRVRVNARTASHSHRVIISHGNTFETTT